MFSLICAGINGSVNNREAGDLKRQHALYDVTVIAQSFHKPIGNNIAPVMFQNDQTTQIISSGLGISQDLVMCRLSV